MPSNANNPTMKTRDDTFKSPEGPDGFLLSPEMNVAGKKKDHPTINDYYRAQAVSDKPIQYQHGLGNYSNVQFGDDRVCFKKSMSQVMFQLNEEAAETFTINENPRKKSRKQRMQDYEEANAVVGPYKIEEMEQMMRDKLQQRTKTGPFQLRKTFKYFDRDGSGGIDFDEFQLAMELMGFQFTDIQQLALFARYDESCSGEVDYSEFVEKVMEKDFKHASSASQNALNTLVSSTFLHQDGLSLEDDDSDIDEDELEQFRLAEVKNLFNLVDNDCSGVIDRTEMTELLNKLGKTLSDDVINMGFNKIDSDSSGHIDFDEFYAWYKSVAYSKKNNVDD